MPPHVFSGSPLDRAAQLRRNGAWLGERLEAEESRFLVLWKLRALVRTDEPRLAWATSAVREAAAPGTGPVFLGVEDAVAHFAVDVSGLQDPAAELRLGGLARFSEVRAVAPALPAGEAAILAHARSLVDWHASHRYCASCGEPSRSAQGGTMRVCTECDTEHFPRTNPVVIAAVVRKDRCLLGRQPGWPPGMFSALAGFVEPGETIEEAVRREVKEETDVDVGRVSYHSSQPWPFPSSLMIGCLAEGMSDPIQVDPHELDAAHWFKRDQVERALADPGRRGDFYVPGPMAIAHHLLRAWIDRGAERPPASPEPRASGGDGGAGSAKP